RIHKVLDIHHHGGGGDKSQSGAEGVGNLGEGAQDEGTDEDAQHQAHEADEPLVGGGNAGAGQHHGYHDGENANDEGDVLADLGLGLEAQLLLGQAHLDVQGPTGGYGVQSGRQGGLGCGVDGGQQQSGDAHRQLKGDPG